VLLYIDCRCYCTLYIDCRCYCTLIAGVIVHCTFIVGVIVHHLMISGVIVHCTLIVGVIVHCTLIAGVIVHCTLIAGVIVHCTLVVGVIVHYTLPMNGVDDKNRLVTTSDLNAHVNGLAEDIIFEPGVDNRSIRLDRRRNVYINITGIDNESECFGNLRHCRFGKHCLIISKFIEFVQKDTS